MPSAADVATDLAAEQADLDEIVAPLTPEHWRLDTPSPRWCIADQIAHLAYFDHAAALAITDTASFVHLRDELLAAGLSDPEATDAVTLGAARDLDSDALLDHWRESRRELATAAATLADDARVEWYGPSMGARSFLTARLMEAWAHGQDVADALGVVRQPTDRIRHIAQLGYITRGWTYANRGLSLPRTEVRVELDAPSGARWTWGPDDASAMVVGPAIDFVMVVTQRRHLADTNLVTSGADAHEWLLMAQAFAGPPTDGPAPKPLGLTQPSADTGPAVG